MILFGSVVLIAQPHKNTMNPLPLLTFGLFSPLYGAQAQRKEGLRRPRVNFVPVQSDNSWQTGKICKIHLVIWRVK